jgi:hypothetical protein
MVPTWMHLFAIFLLSVGFMCAAILAIDVIRHPQHMAIMNIVWPVTALFGTVITVWMYFRYGRLSTKEAMMAAKKQGKEPPNKTETPFSIMVAKGSLHCGSGCSIGDIFAEWLAFFIPTVAVWFGWHHFFEEKMFAVWILDFLFAFVLGIAFQYFTIVPMRHLGKAEGVWQAVKADTLSLSAWQIGMYGFMAIAKFWLFRHVFVARLQVNSPEFWFMMQLAMACGFITSYPVNWWLLKAGIKEKM